MYANVQCICTIFILLVIFHTLGFILWNAKCMQMYASLKCWSNFYFWFLMLLFRCQFPLMYIKCQYCGLWFFFENSSYIILPQKWTSVLLNNQISSCFMSYSGKWINLFIQLVCINHPLYSRYKGYNSGKLNRANVYF